MGLDLDKSLIEYATLKYKPYIKEGRLALFHSNFINLEALEPHKVT